MNHLITSSGTHPAPLHLDLLEGQVALRMTAALSLGTETLPHDISERLRFGRERSLALAVRKRHLAVATTAPQVVGVSGSSAVLGGPPSIWLRLASALPLVALVGGLMLIQHHHDLEQIHAAAEIDSALLADELPPAAYRDPGFSEFLRSADAP